MRGPHPPTRAAPQPGQKIYHPAFIRHRRIQLQLLRSDSQIQRILPRLPKIHKVGFNDHLIGD